MGECCSEVVNCIQGRGGTGISLMRAASGASRSSMQDAVAAGEASLKTAFAALSSAHTLPYHVRMGLKHHIANLLSIKITVAVASAEEALSVGRIGTAAARLHSAQQLIILYEQRGLHVVDGGSGGSSNMCRDAVRGRIHSLVSKVVSAYHAHPSSSWHPFELLTVSLTHAAAALACFDGSNGIGTGGGGGGGDVSGQIDARLSRCELLVAYCEQQATSEVPIRSLFHDTQIGVDVLTPWGGPIYGCSSVCAGVLGVGTSSSSTQHQHHQYGSSSSTGAIFLQEALQSDLDWIARSPLSLVLQQLATQPSLAPSSESPLQSKYCVRYFILNAWYHLCVNDDPVAACDPFLLRAVLLVTEDKDECPNSPLFWLVMRYVEATIRKLDQFALLDLSVNVPPSSTTTTSILHTLARTSSSGLQLISILAKEYPTTTATEADNHHHTATSSLMESIMALHPATTTTSEEHQGGGGVQDNTMLPAMSFFPCKLQSYRDLWWK